MLKIKTDKSVAIGFVIEFKYLIISVFIQIVFLETLHFGTKKHLTYRLFGILS